MIPYTVMIRTLGTAGDKYARTLASIDAQTVRPARVIVVIPEGYSLPPERLGYEEFVRTDKGMVKQRACVFDKVTTELTLSIDDDVEFDSDFVSRLQEQLTANNADFVSPAVVDLNGRPMIGQSDKQHLVAWKYFISNTVSWYYGKRWEGRISPFAIKIARSGGFITNPDMDTHTVYLSQSGSGALIFGKTEKLKRLDLSSELWLEDTGYALPDDQVIYYKLYLQGNRHIYCPWLKLRHLDAMASTASAQRRLTATYAMARNGLIFWHRFIYKCDRRKVGDIISCLRRVTATLLMSGIAGLKSRDFTTFRTSLRGYRDALAFIRSDRYRRLPSPL